MDCKEVSSVLFLFFDNEMEEALLTPFRDHVAGCGDCARRMDYTRKLLLVVREKCLRCTAPDGLRIRILTAMPHRYGESETH
ncbi:MAG TPA: zf-HC2 domain-containing protein [Thermoanaerobaculia bacterium]|jgi:mycothiol system anti-sigma-R factor|nr:zf-HC2 domain-containing protein [Thermoanaerobaculia bacterium]